MEEGTPEGLLGLLGVLFAWISFPSDTILAQFWFGSVAEQAGCSECGSVVKACQPGAGQIVMVSLRMRMPRAPVTLCSTWSVVKRITRQFGPNLTRHPTD